MIFGFTAHAGAGKDTAAQVLVDSFGFTDVKMSNPLKEMLRTLYRCAGLDEETIESKIEGHLKEEPCEILMGKTPRYAMQKLGHEWRNLFGAELWSRIWTSRVASLEEPVVCTDIRYPHEVDALKELGGILVKIERPGLEVDLSHASERGIPLLEADVVLTNSGTIQHLHDQVQRLLP